MTSDQHGAQPGSGLPGSGLPGADHSGADDPAPLDRDYPSSGAGPQDRLPGDAASGAARFEMPVVGDGSTGATPASGKTVRVGGTAGQRTIVAVFGDVKRRGQWTMASQTTAVPFFGEILLDLREATFETDRVVLKIFLAFGSIKVIVPPGVQVDVRGVIVFGDHDHKQRTIPAPGAPSLLVEGYGAFGEIKVLELEVGEVEPKWHHRFLKP
ncbi:MAG: LiaF domain-containing protein [Dermatophilaceae bacterium]